MAPWLVILVDAWMTFLMMSGMHGGSFRCIDTCMSAAQGDIGCMQETFVLDIHP